MIKGLEIHNYQSHKETALTFSPGVNVIIGSSDSGKSAIMRALRWGCTNQPRGEGFRSHWGGETIVSLEVDDESIARYKDKENIYFLDDTEFRAFGTDVPEEILQALNLDENVNIQKQLDRPYLISESAGYVAQHFNRMAHLEKIDKGLKNTQSLIRTAETDIKRTEATKEEKQEKLKNDYGFLPAAEKALANIEYKDTEIQQKKAEIKRLKDLVQQYKDTTDSLKEAKKITAAAKSVEVLLSKEDIIAEKTESFNNLSDTIEALTDRAKSIDKGKEFIKPEKKVLLLLEKQKEIQQKEGIFEVQEDTLFDYKKTLEEIKTEKEEVTKLEKAYEEEQPEVCPLCETKLK